jgi:hypothetical protein
MLETATGEPWFKASSGKSYISRHYFENKLITVAHDPSVVSATQEAEVEGLRSSPSKDLLRKKTN